MTTLQNCNAGQLAYSKHQSRLITSNDLPYHADSAMENRVLGTSRAQTRAAAPRDPFTFYKTHLDTNVPALGEQDPSESDDGSYTCSSDAAATLDGSGDDAQPQARGHTTAYKLAVRLANRSYGAPLATIIEQGPYSTLNSHGSLLSVGRFPSIKAAENRSPNRGSRRRSRSFDEKVLHDIQEDLARELDTSAVAVPPLRPNGKPKAADPASGTATSLTPYRFELQPFPASHSGDEQLDHEYRGVKGFIRGVLQNVRGVSRTRSRSFSMTHAPIMDHRESPLSSCPSSPQVDQQDLGPDMADLPINSCGISAHVPEAVATAATSGDQTKNHSIPSLDTSLSAHMRLPLAKSRTDISKPPTEFGSIPPVLPSQSATCSHERPFSTSVVHAETRGVALKDGTLQASTSHHDMFDTSAQRTTSDGTHMYRGYLTSMKESSSDREVFTSQNDSFCSTMTSSYSGTVLGVDLDLQHDFSRPMRRSQSPPTPMWFTPQMTELERQVSFSESPESMKAPPPGHAPFCSITSSALTSLLPIAAASSLVRLNYNTPKISFYSPSGNLIQPESNPSDHGNSPTVTSSYFNRQHVNAGSSTESMPSRPPLVPVTTPPTHKTPLLSHLRQYHNYGRHKLSQISSFEASVTPKGPVKGCDGMVRETSLTPRSGAFFPHGKDKVHRSVKLAVHDLKAEVKFHEARLITLAAAHSFAPSMPKGKTLQKRHIHKYNTYAREPRVHDGNYQRSGYRQDVLGPLAAHALRVCFCQPDDGAGVPTRATAAGVCTANELFFTTGKPKVDSSAKNAERSLPNARVVSGGRRSEGGDTKRARRDSVLGGTMRRASHTDAVKRKTD